jgi:hypothetical protein
MRLNIDTDKKVTILIFLFVAEWIIDKLVMLGFFLYFK